MLFVSRLSVDRCTLSKMDADAVDLGLSPPIPKSRTRHDDKMILKIGHANANELDTYFPLFSAKRIKGYSTKDKLISQLNQSMADDGINVTDATLVTWESFGYPLMDGVDEEQENGGSLISGANNESCRIVWVQLKHDAQNKLMQPIVQIHPIPRIVNFANHRRWKKTKLRLSR